MNFETKLREELIDEIGELNKLQVGSDEYKIAADGVSKIADRVIEMEKFRVENETKLKAQEMEYEMKLIEIEENRKDRFARNAINVGTFVGGLGFSFLATKWTFKFEETGSISSMVGRQVLQKAVNLFKK